ncbi:MAG: metallophosphoesterase family protein [Actinomycetia bacterium]|jgi:putative phosphoesterase|nr:metallophosphoesterase family protein [Actinomycetes bacterium]
MRIAVISDTHLPRGSRSLAEQCMERLRAADLILHGGDIVGAGFLDELRALGPPIEAVYGNMDEPDLKTSLPKERVVEAEGVRIGLVHIPGPRVGRDARLLARFPGCDAIVFGHTHVPQVEQYEGVWILNPGSPTERRSAPARTMLELVASSGDLAPTLVSLGT